METSVPTLVSGGCRRDEEEAEGCFLARRCSDHRWSTGCTALPVIMRRPSWLMATTDTGPAESSAYVALRSGAMDWSLGVTLETRRQSSMKPHDRWSVYDGGMPAQPTLSVSTLSFWQSSWPMARWSSARLSSDRLSCRADASALTTTGWGSRPNSLRGGSTRSDSSEVSSFFTSTCRYASSDSRAPLPTLACTRQQPGSRVQSRPAFYCPPAAHSGRRTCNGAGCREETEELGLCTSEPGAASEEL